MEEGASSSSPPPPPALLAKMPIGKEPWRKVEKRTGPEDKSSRITNKDDPATKSIPAGVRPSKNQESDPGKLQETGERTSPAVAPKNHKDQVMEQATTTPSQCLTPTPTRTPWSCQEEDPTVCSRRKLL